MYFFYSLFSLLISIGAIAFGFLLLNQALNNNKDYAKADKIRGFRYRVFELYRLHILEKGLEQRQTSIKDLLNLEKWVDDKQRLSLQSIDKQHAEDEKELDDYLSSIDKVEFKKK